MSEGKLIIQSSTFEGALELIEKIGTEYAYVTWTEPVQAADGSFMSAVHYNNNRAETWNVGGIPTRLL